MTWIKVDDHYPEKPETLECGEDAAWLNICGTAYCSRNLTDGRIPKAAVPRLTSKRTQPLVDKLLKVGYWIDEGEHYVVADYLRTQRSKEDIESLREARQNAGRKGGLAKASAKQGASKSLPETETEKETEVIPPTPPPEGGEVNPRANGTNPRAVAERKRKAEAAARQKAIDDCDRCDDKGRVYDEATDTMWPCDHERRVIA